MFSFGKKKNNSSAKEVITISDVSYMIDLYRKNYEMMIRMGDKTNAELTLQQIKMLEKKVARV